jgi:hypothetical protein
MRIARLSASVLLAALCLAPAVLADGAEYEVTITNITPGQVFTPLLVAAHQNDVQPFVPGQPALVELEILAESGNPAPLAALLGSLPQVGDANIADGVLPPGQSTAVRVRAEAGKDHISVLAMLVPTNDAFIGLNTVPAPKGNKSAMYTAIAWDAGTELDDERCESIPGPPNVCQGEGYNPDRNDRGDFVRVHSGIHGIEDLSEAAYDWRNPVARIVITRIPGEGDDDDGDDDDSDDDNENPRRSKYRR